MAAIVPTNLTQPWDYRPLQGCRLSTFILPQVANGDTFTLPNGAAVGARVFEHAWHSATPDSIRVQLNSATGVFTFAGVGVAGGHLHVWWKG